MPRSLRDYLQNVRSSGGNVLRGFIQSLGLAKSAAVASGASPVHSPVKPAAGVIPGNNSSPLASAAEQLSSLCGALGIPLTDIAGKDDAQLRGMVRRNISDQAIEQVACLGIPMSELPVASRGDGALGETLEEIQSQLAEEKNPLRAGQLAVRANALRDKQWRARAQA